MIKRIALFCLFICLLQSTGAQPGNETLYPKVERGYLELKDGRILKGKYVYSPDFEKIRIVTAHESIVMDASEVVRITRKKPGAGEESDSGEKLPQTKNYFIFSELGILPGNPDNMNKMPFIFHTAVNYRLLENLSAGLGASVEFYKETYLPVTINGIYTFNNNRAAPFAMLQAGYQIPIEGSRTKVVNVMPAHTEYIWPGPPVSYDMELKARGGVLLNPSLGIMWQTRSGANFTFSAGYRFHRLVYRNKEKEYDLNVDYNRLSLKLGLFF